MRLASGRVEDWPVGWVYLHLEGQEGPTFCLIGPAGGPALLGAVTLETLGLMLNPLTRELAPMRVLPLMRVPALA